MNTTSTINSSTLGATLRERSTRRVAAIGALAATVAILTLAARRSRQWVHVVMAAAAVIAVVSTAGPLSTALDAATGVLLAAMHLITGAAFLAAAVTVRVR